MTALRAICNRHSLTLLGDTAQAPGARVATPHGPRMAGTLADIGGCSLNHHPHIHCGEGGVLVTDDDRLARRMPLIRNHAEAVVELDDPADPAQLSNMLGFNFRLGEIEAAITAHVVHAFRKVWANLDALRAPLKAAA